MCCQADMHYDANNPQSDIAAHAAFSNTCMESVHQLYFCRESNLFIVLASQLLLYSHTS